MALKQATRILGLKTPLGENVLVLTAFRGREEMSRLFSFHLDMISDNNHILPKDIVGKNVTFSVKLADESLRYFNGFVSRFAAGDEDKQGRRNYRAEVVPWLWFLTRTADCRIFQHKTVPEIMEDVFRDLGFSDFAFRLKGTHPMRDYCVQYRETDFNFVSRLMEEEGIFYFFQHDEGRHVLCVADHKGAYVDCVENSVSYPLDSGTRPMKDHITHWEHRYDFDTGKWSQTDYNFETPTVSLMTHSDTVISIPGINKYEFYDYPGLYAVKKDGEALTDVRMGEEEADHDVVEGTSYCKTFTPGGRFTVREHCSATEEGKSFVITSIQHAATEPLAYEVGPEAGEEYRNAFTCIPDSVTFRPARLTPKPVVQGMQTAVVTGPAGQEIYPDLYGRIKVQFHWDREGKKDENTSCWIRCMQTSAGRQWGAMFIPRIGQEVVVDFLEGDPDRPIVVGVVYNADQMPHYSLPMECTKSYIKTNSSPGGDGYNEIRFEDKKGAEQVFIHAQRNMDLRVQNEYMEHVMRSRHLIVGVEDSEAELSNRELVYGSKHHSIKGDQHDHIEGNLRLMVGNGDNSNGGQLDVVIEKRMVESIGKYGFDLQVEGARTTSIGKSDSLSVGGDSLVSIGGDKHLSIKGSHKQKIEGSESLDVAGSHDEKVGDKFAVDAGQEIHLKSGMKVIIESGVQVSLKGPGGFVDIGPSGVTIQGIMVLINSGGAAGNGSGAAPEAPKSPAAPKDALTASPYQPNKADDSKSGRASTP